MQPSSSQVYASESSLARKDKTQSQREYRSKESDGFSELRDALLFVDPFGTPLGRDATRHQLLITAAKKLRNLADENEKLILRLSAMPTTGPHEPEAMIPRMMTAQNVAATDVAWSTQEYAMDHLLSMSSKPVPPLRDYENTILGWLQGPPSSHGHGHQPYNIALGSESSYQVPPVMDMGWHH